MYYKNISIKLVFLILFSSLWDRVMHLIIQETHFKTTNSLEGILYIYGRARVHTKHNSQ
jgi:hypothetical protein